MTPASPTTFQAAGDQDTLATDRILEEILRAVVVKLTGLADAWARITSEVAVVVFLAVLNCIYALVIFAPGGIFKPEK